MKSKYKYYWDLQIDNFYNSDFANLFSYFVCILYIKYLFGIVEFKKRFEYRECENVEKVNFIE